LEHRIYGNSGQQICFVIMSTLALPQSLIYTTQTHGYVIVVFSIVTTLYYCLQWHKQTGSAAESMTTKQHVTTQIRSRKKIMSRIGGLKLVVCTVFHGHEILYTLEIFHLLIITTRLCRLPCSYYTRGRTVHSYVCMQLDTISSLVKVNRCLCAS